MNHVEKLVFFFFKCFRVKMRKIDIVLIIIISDIISIVKPIVRFKFRKCVNLIVPSANVKLSNKRICMY